MNNEIERIILHKFAHCFSNIEQANIRKIDLKQPAGQCSLNKFLWVQKT